MGIIVGDNFNYQSNKPLDSRAQFASLADMKAYPDASLYDGCLAYVTATKKNYQYDSSNTVDTTTGKWRELETGGGGGTTDYNDLTNKPQIAGVTLSGNQSLASFGLTSNVEAQSSGGTTKSYVNTGEKYNWNTGNTCYGTCATSASTTAKSVTLARGTLNFTAGARIAIKFSYTNTASAPTLTVNGTVKNIKYIDADGNVSTPLIWWNAGDIAEFTYDGTQWLMQPTMQMLFSGQGTKIPREQIYSTTEKVVGCWTDGRPVYQKTIETTTPTTTTTGSMVNTMVSTGISNIRQVVQINAYTVRNNSYFSIPMTIENSNRLTIGMRTNSASTDPNKLSISNSVAEWSGLPLYVTIQYTKTTDSANSFNYGDPNDYSTTEKIVGSWIDGKPLYEKTISCGTLPNNDTKTIAHNVNNLKTIIKTEGFSVKTDGKTIYFPYYTPSSGNAFVEVAASTSTTSIRINTYGWDSSMGVTNFTTTYVTIQYTKTTD